MPGRPTWPFVPPDADVGPGVTRPATDLGPGSGPASVEVPCERVLLAPSAYAPSLGGVEELTAKLARTHLASGIDARVSTMRWPKSLPAHEQVNGVKVNRHVFRIGEGDPKRRALALAMRWPTQASLELQIRRFAPQVLHIQCVSTGAGDHRAVARRLGIPLVVSLQGELTMDASRVFQRSAKLRAILRTLLADADAVTACSQATLDEAEEWFGAPLGERASVVYNGVDLDELRSADAMAHPRPYVFALGRHVPQKGFDVLLDAHARLRATGRHDVDLVLAGDGPETPALRTLAGELGTADAVHLVGRTDRPTTARWFRGAAAFVLSSRHEPFGIVSLEAMAAGVPVVATRVGGVPEFVHDDRNGLLVSPGSADALAAALGRVLDDAELRGRLVAQASHDVEAFSWPAIAAQYQAIYRRVCAFPSGAGAVAGAVAGAEAVARAGAGSRSRR